VLSDYDSTFRLKSKFKNSKKKKKKKKNPNKEVAEFAIKALYSVFGAGSYDFFQF
jgi:hypothetical protein